jgi:hypothetical protein
MKRKYYRLAIVSLALGLTAISFAVTRASGLLVIALPLGLAAVCTGAWALWSIHQRPALLRGTGLAASGAGLGAVGALFSLLVLVGMVLKQFDHQRRQQDQAVHLQKALALSRLPDDPATNFTSNLPIVILHTGSQFISQDAQTVARAEFFDVGNGRASTGAKPDYDGLVTIHLRGSTTRYLPKQSYTVHTVDNKTNQTKVSLLGLPKEEDWVLYAPFEDKTMIRDVLAYQLANKMGHYAPRTRYVELFVNRSSRELSLRDYAGVYVLIEKIKRGQDRVNIAKLKPQARSEPEITGGYIIKRDHSDHRESRFHTSHGGPYFYVYPSAQEITSEQKSWLARYLNSFESALYSADFRDPQKGYAAYLDVDSFIDAHWLIEVGKNVDGFRYSAFLTKDRGGKLQPGPPWDWNRSFGNANYYGGGQVQGWYWTNLRPNEIAWYLRLREDPEFAQRCAARWFELRQNVFDPKKINALVDELAAQLEEAQERNFKRWPVLGQPVTCNYFVGDSYRDEVRWLKKWIEGRIAWIDSQLGRPPDLSQ